MEVDAHSSMYVAPLQVVKGNRSRRKSNGSNRSRRSSASNSARRRSQSKSKNSSKLSLGSQETVHPSAESPRFENYLRATHQFDPSTHSDPSSITMPLSPGDILLVHANHSNGWADGFLLSTGERGWVPTNFCVPLDQEPNRMLMRALTTFWDILHNGHNSITSVLGNQEYMRGLIAGVRRTLEFTHCLNRESAFVKSHRVIRQTRKSLLFDLSGLVKRSKHLQECIKEDPNFQVREEDFRDLVNRAFKMVMRAVRFVDVWMEDVDFGENADSVMETLDDRGHPNTLESSQTEQPGPAHPNSQASSDQKGVHDSSQSLQDLATRKHQNRGSLLDRPRLSRNSKTFVRPGASEMGPRSPQLPPAGNMRTSMTHRASISSRPLCVRTECLASEKLSTAEGHFLGLLGGFVGPHLQNRTSTDLLFTTKGVLDSCRKLLAIIEAVEQRQGARPNLSEKTSDRMYGVFAEFLQAARDMLQPEMSEENGGASPEHLVRMGEVATSCVRCTGECVATARSIIDIIGDFEIEPLEPRIHSGEHESTESEDVHPGEKVDACVFEYYPPEPTSIPPSPPSKQLKSPPPLHTSFLESDIQLYDLSGLLNSHPLGFLPPVSSSLAPLLSFDDFSPTSQISSMSENSRVESLGKSSAESGSTYIGSLRNSGRSGLSLTSTRATSPETLSTSFEDDCEAGEARIMEKTFAQELMYNKDSQVSGGSLPALVECLTTCDSTPDVLFTSTFYLTFRLFAKPVEFAEALIDRFDYVKESPQIALPVRLRVYNVFKQWLETHWRNDCDQPALTHILPFAIGPLAAELPSAGKRLTELVDKVSSADGLLVPRLISSMGKTNTAHALYVMPDTPLPPTIITKSQLTGLKNWKLHGATLSILDFDPLELARQITMKESRIFCSILPEELLASEWTKKTSSMAVNVRAMSTIATDLANLVADCILRMEDAQIRAKLIKHWIKIADKCLELNNYDSLIAIICSLESATISRLKKTWDMVSTKNKGILENLRGVVELSRNYTVLRQRLQNHVPPCLPFVGIYLTDLTFVDIGNQPMRQLPNDGDEKGIEVINFDKHMKTAKIIGELQRFQIPYRLQEQADLQIWLQDQLIRARAPDENTTNKFYRRSLLLEPRESQASRASDVSKASSEASSIKPDKTSLFSFKWASSSQKDRLKHEDSLSRQTSLDESLSSQQRMSGASKKRVIARSTSLM